MGFYRTLPHLKEWLIIGPYQGTHGCLRIAFGKGVCGAAAKLQQSQVVPDVHAFPGHIACASSTQSEIVVPIMSPNGVLGVLDIDSDSPAAFDEVDQRALESICMLLSRKSPPQRQGQDDIADRELLSMGTKLTT
ncbi:g8730 [Coccomyxa viridis]|uniref:G8730 protein n=1 Tax=Coccomyxa viridis TaxID=1274662 RepID=A0ABP1G130_9CHLO